MSIVNIVFCGKGKANLYLPRTAKRKLLPIKSLKKQGGIALIQILIIVAILTTVALYISKSAKQQVQIAQWAVDRTYATVSVHSAHADVMFELLTSTWGANTIASSMISDEVGTEFEYTRLLNSKASNKQHNNIQSSVGKNGLFQNETSTNINSQQQNIINVPWNLYNQAFKLNENVTVQLQDQAGLINLHHPAEGVVADRLRYHGFSESDAQHAEATLLDWQDGDNIRRNYGDESNLNTRNNVMPDKREWLLQGTIELEPLKAILNDFSIYGAGHLNLLTSPMSILAALSNDDVAYEVVKRREQFAQQMQGNIDPVTGQYLSENNQDVNKQQLVRLMDISNEIDVFFVPSRTLKITLTASKGETRVERIVFVKLTPYTRSIYLPFNIMQVRG